MKITRPSSYHRAPRTAKISVRLSAKVTVPAGHLLLSRGGRRWVVLLDVMLVPAFGATVPEIIAQLRAERPDLAAMCEAALPEAITYPSGACAWKDDGTLRAAICPRPERYAVKGKS